MGNYPTQIEGVMVTEGGLVIEGGLVTEGGLVIEGGLIFYLKLFKSYRIKLSFITNSRYHFLS